MEHGVIYGSKVKKVSFHESNFEELFVFFNYKWSNITVGLMPTYVLYNFVIVAPSMP